MGSGIILRVSWLFLFLDTGACYPNFRHDHKTSVETSNLHSQAEFQSPSYIPKAVSLTYETDSDSSDSEDDVPWIWRHSTYVNPEKTPAKSQQESSTSVYGGGAGPGVYAGGAGPGVYAGGAAPGVYAGGAGAGVYAGGAGPGVYAGEAGAGVYAGGAGPGFYGGGAGQGVYAGGASSLGTRVYAGDVGIDGKLDSVGSRVYAGETDAYSGRAGSGAYTGGGGVGSGVYPDKVDGVGGLMSGVYAGGMGYVVASPRPDASGSSMGSDYGYYSQAAGTPQELSSMRGSLATARQQPSEAWNTGQVPEQLIEKPPVHPSSLVVQSRGVYERARDFHSDFKYNHDIFDYIPLTEMHPKTGSEGQKHS